MTTLSGTNPTYPGLSLYQSSASDSSGTLGMSVESTDGRAFRLVKAGASALVSGNLVQGPATVANHQNLTTAVTAIASGTTAQTVTVTLGATAATANQYAGGVIVINAGTGIGQTLTIASHPAAASAASLTLTLEDKLAVALDATSKSCLIANVYNGVIASPTTSTNTIVGVAISAIPAGYYGWVQTRGPVSALGDASVAAAGLGIMPSTTTAGTITVATATGTRIGTAIIASVSAEARPVMLALK